mmetsp:Transcript_54044/g.145695  ORF Transcript_54044/g.145695 Transcript_54044/m.145695 type:complete len:130 (-) Transcript_54044:42-431(-)
MYSSLGEAKCIEDTRQQIRRDVRVARENKFSKSARMHSCITSSVLEEQPFFLGDLWNFLGAVTSSLGMEVLGRPRTTIKRASTRDWSGLPKRGRSLPQDARFPSQRSQLISTPGMARKGWHPPRAWIRQ